MLEIGMMRKPQILFLCGLVLEPPTMIDFGMFDINCFHFALNIVSVVYSVA